MVGLSYYMLGVKSEGKTLRFTKCYKANPFPEELNIQSVLLNGKEKAGTIMTPALLNVRKVVKTNRKCFYRLFGLRLHQGND